MIYPQMKKNKRTFNFFVYRNDLKEIDSKEWGEMSDKMTVYQLQHNIATTISDVRLMSMP